VSKARNEAKITHMNHSIVKALPQVIYMKIQACDKAKFSDLSSFTKRRLASHVKAYPCHT
jgi:hypothetical protein